jgi:pyruvate/2-oxoglutarate/acetoin dehydrogenase E1 component
VLFFEHKALYPVKEEVPDAEFLIPFGQACVVRAGSDLTLVTNQLARREAEAAARCPAGPRSPSACSAWSAATANLSRLRLAE